MLRCTVLVSHSSKQVAFSDTRLVTTAAVEDAVIIIILFSEITERRSGHISHLSILILHPWQAHLLGTSLLLSNFTTWKPVLVYSPEHLRQLDCDSQTVV